MNDLAPIQRKIYEIRGQKVILDRDLAALYQVETRVLNQAVKRNLERFPEDFMFQLTKEEWEILRSQIVTSSDTEFLRSQNVTLDENWKSQFVTSNSIKMGVRKMPYAFTEHGVMYIEDILRDQNEINEETSMQLELINQSLAELQANPQEKPRKRIGFNAKDDEYI